MDPGLLTLRELVWMTEAKQTDAWNHTATLLAMLGNIHRDPKKGAAFKPAEFHPFLNRPAASGREPKISVGILKDIFVKKK